MQIVAWWTRKKKVIVFELLIYLQLTFCKNSRKMRGYPISCSHIRISISIKEVSLFAHYRHVYNLFLTIYCCFTYYINSHKSCLKNNIFAKTIFSLITAFMFQDSYRTLYLTSIISFNRIAIQKFEELVIKLC